MNIVKEYMFKKPNEILTLEDEYIELIIIALQEERRLWVEQYTRVHNDYVDLQKQNVESKEKNARAINYIDQVIMYKPSSKELDKELNELIGILVEVK